MFQGGTIAQWPKMQLLGDKVCPPTWHIQKIKKIKQSIIRMKFLDGQDPYGIGYELNKRQANSEHALLVATVHDLFAWNHRDRGLENSLFNGPNLASKPQ